MTSEAQKRQAALWEHKWLKNGIPFFKACLNCQLSCSQKVRYATGSYDIFSCPKENKGEPAFPYKWEEMLREHKKEIQEKEKHGVL